MTYQFRLREEPFEFYSEFDNAGESLTTDLAETWQGEVSRKSPDYIRWVQRSLNQILGLRLTEDGIMGSQTRSAIRSFQQQKRLRVDGIVGPQTEAALIAAGASPPPGGVAVPTPVTTLANLKVNTPLPRSGPGFYSYKPTAQQYGLPETIQALQAIGAAWQRAHPQGPRIGIGDISLRGGGPMRGHKSHQKGVDVDVRLVRNDGREEPTRYQSPQYSRALTQELINLIRANGILGVRYIFFNDPAVSGVTPWPNHDDHLHVRFIVPGTPSRTTRAGGTTLAWGARVSAEFRRRVRQIGAELGIDPNFLMAVMAFETGETFSPSIRNPGSGATGLIQFLPSTARGLGTTTDQLAAMTAEQQLDYVARYFRPYRGRLATIEDVYMVVLWPKAVGAANATVLFAAPSREYELNRGLDRNGDGQVTKEEAAAPVRAKLSKGQTPPFVG